MARMTARSSAICAMRSASASGGVSAAIEGGQDDVRQPGRDQLLLPPAAESPSSRQCVHEAINIGRCCLLHCPAEVTRAEGAEGRGGRGHRHVLRERRHLPQRQCECVQGRRSVADIGAGRGGSTGHCCRCGDMCKGCGFILLPPFSFFFLYYIRFWEQKMLTFPLGKSGISAQKGLV